MNLHNIMGAWMGVFLAGCLVPMALAGEKPQPAKAVVTPDPAVPQKLSWFRADKDGVLWFQQGDDGQTKYSASLILSAVTDGIVITVTANEMHIDNAVGLALKMRNVLQKGEHTPDKIPVVAWKDHLPGVGYRFYTEGLACDHETLGKEGLFTPAEAKQMLGRVAKHYRILREEFVAAGKWGTDHADWKALRIVGP